MLKRFLENGEITKPTGNTAILTAAGVIALDVTTGIPGRNLLAEPLDLPDHANNFFGTMVLATMATEIVASHLAKKRPDLAPLLVTRTARVGVALGACISNVVFEGFFSKTGDPLDIAYGVIGTAIGIFGARAKEESAPVGV